MIKTEKTGWVGERYVQFKLASLGIKKGVNQRASEYKCTSDPRRTKRNGKSRSILVHRKIWEDNFGMIPKGNMIHHINGDKKDNRIENLECLTRKEHGERHKKSNRKRIVYSSGSIKVIKL